MANQRVSPGRLASPEASVFAAHFPANIIRRSHPSRRPPGLVIGGSVKPPEYLPRRSRDSSSSRIPTCVILVPFMYALPDTEGSEFRSATDTPPGLRV